MAQNTISAREAAIGRGVTLKYIYDQLLAGRIRGAMKVGKRWRIPESYLVHTHSRGPADGQLERVGARRR